MANPLNRVTRGLPARYEAAKEAVRVLERREKLIRQELDLYVENGCTHPRSSLALVDAILDGDYDDLPIIKHLDGEG